MTAKFYPKPAQFERKSQVCPNSLVFNHELSDSGMRLILALNAIATCAPNWVACQTDLQKRFRWGVEKMRNAIKDCVSQGYLKVMQNREKGRFLCNEFEFDIDGNYQKNDDTIIEDNPSHIEYEPEGTYPMTENSSPKNLPLPCIKTEPCSVECTLLGSDAPSTIQKEQEVPFKHQNLVKDDIHAYCISSKLDWSIDEISHAWEAFTKSVGFINDPFEYIKAIIRNVRSNAKTKKQKENEKCQKEKKQILNTNDELQTKKETHSIEQLKDIKKMYLEVYGTEEHPLAKFCGAPKDLKSLMRFY